MLPQIIPTSRWESVSGFNWATMSPRAPAHDSYAVVANVPSPLLSITVTTPRIESSAYPEATMSGPVNTRAPGSAMVAARS